MVNNVGKDIAEESLEDDLFLKLRPRGEKLQLNIAENDQSV